jgi:multiple antibiotic resistance protein
MEGTMTEFSFVMTIFFLLLGPVKIIPAFAAMTRDADASYRRRLAVWGTVFAAVICGLVALLTKEFVTKYQLSLPAFQIIGGIILLVSALRSIFPRDEGAGSPDGARSARQAALAPLASPIIVTPAGIAAIMVFVVLEPRGSGGMDSIVLALAIVMALDLLVMLLDAYLVRIPGVMIALRLLGSILVVVQGALAVQAIIYALMNLGLVARQ